MVDTIRGMFGSSDKLSNSVIYTVVGQNDGDVSQAVDMLLNIANDDEAIEAIRTMGADDKKKMQLEMKKDQEKRNADRQVRLQYRYTSHRTMLDEHQFLSQAQLQREIDEEKKRIADEQQRIADEKKKLERERAVQLAREKKLREEQERLKQQREDELKKIEELVPAHPVRSL